MGDRLDPHLLLDQNTGEQRAHAALRPRSVRNIHRIDARVTQRAGVAQHLRRIHSARRHDLDRRDELSAGDLPRPLRSLGKGYGRHARILGGNIGLHLPSLPRRHAWLPRRQGSHTFDHRRDVLGRGSTAAADDLGARLDEVMRVGRHVLGARHVHAAPAHITRHPGVGLRAQLAPGDRRHLLDGVENDLRANGAVEADHIGAKGVQRLGDILDRYSVRRVTIGADRHLRDDGHGRIHFVSGENRLLDLVHIGERLENEEITAALLERLELLAECRPCFVETGGPERLETNAQRTNCAGDEKIVVRDFACNLHRGAIDVGNLRLEPILRQLDPVRPEGVRLQHLRSRLFVRLVNIAHEVGRAKVQFVVALVDEHALVVEHRAHRAVEDDDLVRVEKPGDQRVLRQQRPPVRSRRRSRRLELHSTSLQDDG